MHIDYLNIFPVKALAGISVKSAVITAKGLQYDRRFMLIDASNRFITQRTHPQLTAFSVELEGNHLKINHATTGQIAFSAEPPESESFSAIVWNDTVQVSAVGDEVDQFFTEALNETVRLVGMPKTSHRQVNLMYGKEGDDVSFADAYPILLLGTASIDEFNSRIKTPVPLNRFRANIGVSGSQPWAEDIWNTVHIGNAEIQLVKPCERCIVIRTDQKTGERHDEPMKTLLTYRRMDNKVMVGMNCIPTTSAIGAEIHVGQTLTI
ncbi:MAG: MOSC domain-containing protein [Bacteroidetes bacterium]|nr:MOSC domain-containing protein [Bacteroidota bacterium]